MNKNTITIDASVTAFAGTLSVARASQLAAVEAWADVYEAAAFMLGQVPSRSLAKQLEASGASCNKDTAGFYADAAIWAPFMRTDWDSETESVFMHAAVKADQSATLLPHECVSYGRNRAGLTIDEVREVMRDAVVGLESDDSDSVVESLAKAIRKLRTKAKAKRTPQPPEIDDKTDDQTDGETDDQGDDESAPAGDRAANLISAIVGPMNALTAAIRSGEVQLDEHQKHTLNAHWSELIKASRDVAAA